MNELSGRARLATLSIAALFAAACTSSGPATGGKPSRSPAATPPRGTLGIETAPISRETRKRLKLSSAASGAVVVEVLPGGPGAAAGIRPDDVVQELGGVRIAGECEFADAGYNMRSLAPVRVVVTRAGSTVESSVVPVEQAPFFEDLCRRGVASGCFREAWSLGTAESHLERALSLDESACHSGSAAACADLGVRLLERADRAKDTIATFERACMLGNGAGCAHEAFLYATGTLVSKDHRRASGLYVRGCDFGDAKACYNVGLMADEGRGGPRNLKLAVARYEEACEGGSSTACTNLGFFAENGRGVPKDPERAALLYQRGCDGSHCQASNLNGCLNLGRAYRDGIGVAKDAARAGAIFRDACERPFDKADVGFERNSSRGCSLLGALSLDTDDAKALELSELGCTRGDSFGCFNASAIYSSGSGVAADPVKATSYLDKACQAGDGEGCFDLAIAYEKGTGVSPDRERATASFRKACALGFEKACGRKGR